MGKLLATVTVFDGKLNPVTAHTIVLNCSSQAKADAMIPIITDGLQGNWDGVNGESSSQMVTCVYAKDL